MQSRNGSSTSWPPRQIFHMLYRDLVGDTLPPIETMYRHFGLPFSDRVRAAMAEYLARDPRDARPVHRFDGDSAGTIAKARGLYRRYQDRFAIPDE